MLFGRQALASLDSCLIPESAALLTAGQGGALTESRPVLALLLPLVLCCGLAQGQGPPREPELGAWTKRPSIGGGWIQREDLHQPPPADREYEDIVAGRLSATRWGGLRTFRAPFRRPPNRFGRVHPAIKGLFFHVQVGGGVLTLFRIETRTEGAAKFVLRNFCRSPSSIPPGATKASERRGKVVVTLVLVPFPDADLGGALPVERYMFAPWLEDSIRQPDPNLPSEPLPSRSYPIPTQEEEWSFLPDEEGWLLRVRAGLGALYVSTSERRRPLSQTNLGGTLATSRATSEFDGIGYGIRLRAEGNLSGFSPHLSLRTASVEGTEKTRSADPRDAPQNDLLLTSLTLDLGLGFRIERWAPFTIVPSLGYALDYLTHKRSNLRVLTGFARDLSGSIREEAEQRSVGHGFSLGMALEYAYNEQLEAEVFLVCTYLADVETDNELTRSFDTQGYMVRGGTSLNYWFIPQLSVRLSLVAGLREVAESKPRVELGGASPRQPQSSTFWGSATVGIEVKF